MHSHNGSVTPVLTVLSLCICFLLYFILNAKCLPSCVVSQTKCVLPKCESKTNPTEDVLPKQETNQTRPIVDVPGQLYPVTQHGHWCVIGIIAMKK